MARARSSVIVAVLLLWTVMPALRCLVPSEVLSEEERACCKRMVGECGQMPSNHDCCKKITASPQTAVITEKIAVTTTDAAVAATVRFTLAVNIRPAVFIDAVVQGPSPPPLISTTILRI